MYIIINHFKNKLGLYVLKCGFPAILEICKQKFPSDMQNFCKKFFLKKTVDNFTYSSQPSINDKHAEQAQVVILKNIYF